MAKVEIKLRSDLGRLEVGDIVVTALHGARLIVAGSDEFLAIDLEDGTVGARGGSLENLERLYCDSKHEFRIIKKDNIRIGEV